MFEVVRVDAALRSLIGGRADAQALLDAARQTGTTIMLEDGLGKAVHGLNTMGEVLRVCG